MSPLLPVVFETSGAALIDPDTYELVDLRHASDRAIITAAQQIAELDAHLYAAKRALAAELHDRHGVGTTTAGGYQFQIAESQSWPIGATGHALSKLVTSGAITLGDANRAMPDKPKPDARILKALAGRLAVKDPDAARILADAATVSPPSIRQITPVAVDATPSRQELPQ